MSESRNQKEFGSKGNRGSPKKSPDSCPSSDQDAYQVQSPLQKTRSSPRISPVQRTPSPLAGLPSKRTRSPHKKSTSPNQHAFKESPSKRNRSVMLKQTTPKKRSPVSPPLTTIRSPVSSQPSTTVRSPASSHSTTVRTSVIKSPSATDRSPVSLSPSATVRSPVLPPSKTVGSPSSSSHSTTVRSPVSSSTSATVRSPVSKPPFTTVGSLSTSPSATVGTSAYSSPSKAVESPSSSSPSEAVESPSSSSPPEAVESPSSTSPSAAFRSPLSASSSTTVGQSLSTSPSSMVQSFSKDTSEGSSRGHPTQRILSLPQISPVQKTHSPLAGLSSKRARSPEKSTSPEVSTLEESPSKRNRSVKLNQGTQTVCINPLLTSSSKRRRHSASALPPLNVRSPLASSPSSVVQYPTRTSPASAPAVNRQSPATITSTKVQYAMRKSPSPRVPSPLAAQPRTTSDACCQVNLCCNSDTIIKSVPTSQCLERSFSESQSSINECVIGSDGNELLPPKIHQHFDSTRKSTAKKGNNESGREPELVQVEETGEDITSTTAEEQIPGGNVSELSVQPEDTPRSLSIKKKEVDWDSDIWQRPDELGTIIQGLLNDRMEFLTQPLSFKKDRAVAFLGACPCGKTSLILKMLNKFDEFNKYCKTPFDYTFVMQFEDETPMMDVVFRDSDTTCLNTRLKSYRQSDLFILCFAIDDTDSYLKVTMDLRQLVLECSPSASLMLVGLKSDLRKKAKDSGNKITLIDEEFVKGTYTAQGFISYSECSIHNESAAEFYWSISRFLRNL